MFSRHLQRVLSNSSSAVNTGDQLTMIATRALSSARVASFQTKPFKLHRLDYGPSTEVSVTAEDALKYYREMATVRRLEAAANALYKEKAVRGFCHLSTGQEAVCVGMEAAIT